MAFFWNLYLSKLIVKIPGVAQSSKIWLGQPFEEEFSLVAI
jgi:hypothetical protein